MCIAIHIYLSYIFYICHIKTTFASYSITTAKTITHVQLFTNQDINLRNFKKKPVAEMIRYKMSKWPVVAMHFIK